LTLRWINLYHDAVALSDSLNSLPDDVTWAFLDAFSIDKTFGTAQALRGRFLEVTDWTDHILLPEESMSGWLAAKERATDARVEIDAI